MPDYGDLDAALVHPQDFDPYGVEPLLAEDVVTPIEDGAFHFDDASDAHATSAWEPFHASAESGGPAWAFHDDDPAGVYSGALYAPYAHGAHDLPGIGHDGPAHMEHLVDHHDTIDGDDGFDSDLISSFADLVDSVYDRIFG